MAPKKETFKRIYGVRKLSRKEQLRTARKKRRIEAASTVTVDNMPSNSLDSEGSALTVESLQNFSEITDFVESAMQRKFRLLEDETAGIEENCYGDAGKPSFLFMDVNILYGLIKGLGCNKCMSFGHLKIDINTTYLGLAAELLVTCSACNNVIFKSATSTRCKAAQNVKKMPLEVNRRAVFASIYTGSGFSGMQKLSMIMGMPIMHHQTFLDHYTCIGNAVEATVSCVISKAVDAVRKAYSDTGVYPDENGILNIAVSYDGSWMKRGHISNFGVGVVIDLLTGLVLDFEVLSRYCHTCAMKEKKLKSTEFIEWFQQHKSTCSKTFTGSAGAMEAQAALAIWRRSVSKHKLRYLELLSDGDAKTFQALTEDNIYGSDHIITKEECVNHVGKRMFTALSKIITENKSKGTRLGGKGQGKLTRHLQEKLAVYYKKAIMNNSGDIKQMRDAVFATLFHSISTDDEPHHSRCPKGCDSWCFFNKALALGKTPGKHEDYVNTCLSKEVAEKLFPVYQRLGDEALLQRCLKGKTQNANESLPSVIWKCPKIKFLHLDRVNMGVGLAIIDFNYSHRGIHFVLKNLGIEPGSLTNTTASSDEKRLLKSADRASAKAQHAEKVKHAARI